jgi:DNA-binding NarL/FixJ family response regulator
MEILIVDNSQIINARLKAMISEANSKAIIHQAESYTEAIKLLLTESKPDVVVLDIGLPENMSADLLTLIKILKEETAVIVLSINIDRLTRQKYFAAGADFFLDKYHEFEKIAGIINTIANNKS